MPAAMESSQNIENPLEISIFSSNFFENASFFFGNLGNCPRVSRICSEISPAGLGISQAAQNPPNPEIPRFHNFENLTNLLKNLPKLLTKGSLRGTRGCWEMLKMTKYLDFFGTRPPPLFNSGTSGAGPEYQTLIGPRHHGDLANTVPYCPAPSLPCPFSSTLLSYTVLHISCTYPVPLHRTYSIPSTHLLPATPNHCRTNPLLQL